MSGAEVKEKRTPVQFKLERIKLISSNINIPSHFSVTNQTKFKFSLSFVTEFIEEFSRIRIVVDYKFYLTENFLKLLEIKVATDFRIENFSDVVKEDQVYPTDFLEFITNISLNHARGVQSQVVNGTEIEGLLMPILKPEEVRARLK
jgi:hypothetical protein